MNNASTILFGGGTSLYYIFSNNFWKHTYAIGRIFFSFLVVVIVLEQHLDVIKHYKMSIICNPMPLLFCKAGMTRNDQERTIEFCTLSPCHYNHHHPRKYL